MENPVNLSSIELFNEDALAVLESLPDNCVDLIVTDPLYFQVKTCAWDNQWPDVAAYLAWLDQVLAGCYRVLKPAGSLYLFCSARLAADTELLVREHFQVLNHIVWAKPSGPWRRAHKESLRAYFPATERILFAGHYPGPYHPKTRQSHTARHTLRKQLFKPLSDYFCQARAAPGVTAGAIEQATGKKMVSHWFGVSQWRLPGEEDYLKLQALFARLAGERGTVSPLNRPYQALARRQQALQADYQRQCDTPALRQRYFHLTAAVPYTDVWTFAPVQYYPGKHPCEKPADLLAHIIRSSSREGDLVADFFMGSGATLKAALKLGRCGLGVERDSERFVQTRAELTRLRRK